MVEGDTTVVSLQNGVDSADASGRWSEWSVCGLGDLAFGRD